MKSEGILEKYESPELKNVINPFPDFDGSFTAIRLGTLGIAYNKRHVKEAPAQWSDMAHFGTVAVLGIEVGIYNIPTLIYERIHVRGVGIRAWIVVGSGIRGDWRAKRGNRRIFGK